MVNSQAPFRGGLKKKKQRGTREGKRRDPKSSRTGRGGSKVNAKSEQRVKGLWAKENLRGGGSG